MTDQLALVQVAPTPAALTDRQKLAYEYVRENDGVTCDEVGAWLHASRPVRPHPLGERCEWCARDGRQVLTSKALRPLVTYRRAPGGYQYLLRDPAARTAADDTAQVADLPGDLFEDIFTSPGEAA